MALNHIAKFNWEKILTKVEGGDVKRSLNLIRAKANEITNAAGKYGQAPEKIDFAAYKSKLRFTGAAVDALEKIYANKKLPSFHATLPAYEAQQREAVLATVDNIVNATKQDIAVLNAQLAESANLQITRETTFAELSARFPQFAREVEKEIKNHEWSTKAN
jgi:hypothetical protein